jgi:GNAT superfamily N-acetyltransferase
MLNIDLSTSVPGASLRMATPGDVPTILRFVRELADYEREPQAVVATEAMLHESLFGQGFGRGPTCEAILGDLDGTPQGFALFFMNYSTWKGRAGLYLEDLYVTPASRGRGLGKALLTTLARIARARGCVRMEWSVLDWNTPAIEFYTSIGAEPMNEWTVYRMREEAIGRLAKG